jgi:hypothetical protein
MDGFPSLILIYMVFLLLLEACYDLVIDEPPTELMSNFTFVADGAKDRSWK